MSLRILVLPIASRLQYHRGILFNVIDTLFDGNTLASILEALTGWR